ELANPFFSPHLDFYPEDTQGADIYKLLQFQKWLTELPPNLRMGKLLYQSSFTRIVVTCMLKSGSKCPQIHCLNPICSYPSMSIIFGETYLEIQIGNSGFLDLCSGKMWDCSDTPKSHLLPNQWREKADGKVIRHVPINLYANDTLRSVSKKWNKHLLHYFTLAGLPPKLSRMEYNRHFLLTSNRASVLELGDQIVDEINTLATDGVVAQDASLAEEVLIMSVFLCFQADYPMHAGVTNTLVPNVSLNPCQMSCLQASTTAQTRTEDYVRGFLHLDPSGQSLQQPLPTQTWANIKYQATTLWKIGKTSPYRARETPWQWPSSSSLLKGISLPVQSFLRLNEKAILEGKTADWTEKQEIPPYFNHYSNALITQIFQLQLIQWNHHFQHFLKTIVFDRSNISPFYQMGSCKILTRPDMHHLTECTLGRTSKHRLRCKCINHSDDKCFILKYFSLHPIVYHRQLSSLSIPSVNATKWKSEISPGIHASDYY
ncbi:hypothetical protein VP01_2488g1, partial [Puccinia sorghi]